MDALGSLLLERLRQQLADLESNQRKAGGAATAGFWTTPSPDAAEPVPTPASGEASVGAARAGSAEGATSGSTDEPRPSREFPEPLTIHWANWSHVGGAYASGFAFAAASLDRPQMEPDRMSEPDLIESVTQLGLVERHKEVNLVRIVTQLEARGVASPGGLTRVDWLRQVDPTLTASAAKAIVTCAGAFNEPRWAQLRDAVIGEATPAGDGDGGTERVTVGKAAQVIDFFHRLKPVADPDDLDQAVARLTGQAGGLRWEQLARLARELSDQVRPPKDADQHDQKRRDARGLRFTGPNAAGMVGMTGTLDPEGAAIIKSAIDP